MAAQLDDRDRHYLRLAVELSRGFLHDERRWPFGALVVVEDQVVGQGVNQVVELHDPTHTPKCWRCARRRCPPGQVPLRRRRALRKQPAVPDVPGRLLLGMPSPRGVRRDKLKSRAARIASSPGASSRGGKKSGSGSSPKQGGTTAQKKKAGAKGGKAAAGKK
jgi:hypothetical protein